MSGYEGAFRDVLFFTYTQANHSLTLSIFTAYLCESKLVTF